MTPKKAKSRPKLVSRLMSHSNSYSDRQRFLTDDYICHALKPLFQRNQNQYPRQEYLSTFKGTKQLALCRKRVTVELQDLPMAPERFSYDLDWTTSTRLLESADPTKEESWASTTTVQRPHCTVRSQDSAKKCTYTVIFSR